MEAKINDHEPDDVLDHPASQEDYPQTDHPDMDEDDKDIDIDNNDSEEIPDGDDVDLNRAE